MKLGSFILELQEDAEREGDLAVVTQRVAGSELHPEYYTPQSGVSMPVTQWIASQALQNI